MSGTLAPRLVPLGAGALAALYPLSAEVAGPLALLAILAAGGLALLIVRHPVTGVAGALALLPFTNLVAPSSLSLPGNASQPVQFLALPLLAVAVGAVALLHKPVRSLPTSRVGLAILAFLATTALAAVHTPVPETARTELFMLALAALLALATLQLCDRPRDIELVAGGALLGALLAGTQGVLQAKAGLMNTPAFLVDGEYVERVQGSFLHPNRYGAFLAMAIPLAVAVAAQPGASRRLRWLALAAAAAAIPGLALSYSRTAMVGMAIGSLLWLVLVRPRAAIATALIGAVAVFALAPANLVTRFRDAPGSEEVTERVAVWDASLRIFEHRPWIGVGLGGFKTAYARLSDDSSARGGRLLLSSEGGPALPTHAHNLYMQVATEQGVVGLAAFLALAVIGLGGCLWGARRSPTLLARAVCLGVGAVWGTWLALGVGDAKLYEEHGVLLLVLTAAAARARAIATATEAPPAHPSSGRAKPGRRPAGGR